MVEKIRNVEVRGVECDELWAFIGKKQKRVRPEDDQNLGDNYTFVAIERHFQAGSEYRGWQARPADHDTHLLRDFAKLLRDPPSRVTTDGFAPYRSAITTTLHDRLTGFAQLIKVYRAASEGEGRYSPAEVASVETVPVFGNPDPERICTSIVERSNLSTRMGLRRFTRLTNAFSKSFEHHWAAVACWFAFYKPLPRPQVAENHACDGCGHYGSCVERAGIVTVNPMSNILLAGLGFAYLIGSMVVNLVGIAFIVYFVVKGPMVAGHIFLVGSKGTGRVYVRRIQTSYGGGDERLDSSSGFLRNSSR